MAHPNIEGRKFKSCSSLTIDECVHCNRFSLSCSHYRPGKDGPYYNLQLVFTDGACSNNGRAYAKAGLGITLGGDDEWSIPVDDAIDPHKRRTSQRAELLAAILGLKKLHRLAPRQNHQREVRAKYVIITDSEYVVKGITEWFPVWGELGWQTSYGEEPANLDLFQRLDRYLTNLERQCIAVGFWHIPREDNHRAGALAKKATRV